MLTKRGNTVSKLNWTETKMAVKFGLLRLKLIMNQNFNFSLFSIHFVQFMPPY